MPTASPHEMPLWLRLRKAGAGPDDILREFGIVHPAVPILKIVEELGVEVTWSSELKADGKMTATESDENGNARAAVILDMTTSIVRQRFTLAHEIGHLMMHPLGVVYRGGGRGWSPRESEANDFAARLLMPEWMIVPYARATRADAGRMATIFGVSYEAMGIRLGNVIGSM